MSGGPLGRTEPLLFFVCSFTLADVHEEGLGVERLSDRISDDGRFLPDPDSAPLSRNQAVLAAERAAVIGAPFVFRKDSRAVLGMEQSREEAWFGTPLCGRVTEHRLHVGTDVQTGAPVTRHREPRQERKTLDDRSVLDLRLPHALS